MHGPWPIHCLETCSRTPRTSLNKKWACFLIGVIHSLSKSVAGVLFFFVLLFAVALVILRISFRYVFEALGVVVVVGFSHVYCLSRCCWFGRRRRGDRGRGSCWLFESVAHMDSHSKPSCAVVSHVVSFMIVDIICEPWLVVGTS